MLKKEDKNSKDAKRSSITLEPQALVIEAHMHDRMHSILHIPKNGEWHKTQFCGGVTYIVLSALLIILSLIEIIVTVFGATTERFYDTPHSSRMVAMIVLAVLGVIAFGIAIYAIVGVTKKHSQPLYSAEPKRGHDARSGTHVTATLILLILAVLQALITGISVHVTEFDEMGITRYVSESFYRAKDGDLTQLLLWDSTQSGLECCGLYSPEDYRDPYGPFNFPPDIPVSCCPSYRNPNATLDKEREVCKASSLYYRVGCQPLVVEVLKGASFTVIIVTVLLILTEVTVAILGSVLSKKRREEKHEQVELSTRTSPLP